MFFYLALTIMVIYTLFFFYVDTRNYINKGGSFGEAMTNIKIPENIKEAQEMGGEQLKNFLDNNPNLKEAVDAGKPDFMKGITNAMPHLMTAYTKSKSDLDKAQPHLMSAYTKAQPDIKNAFDNSFNDFNEAYQKSRTHIGSEMVNVGNKIIGSDSPQPATENDTSKTKNNNISQATQSSETPKETQEFTTNNPRFSRLANGYISKPGKGICPNGCLAPQYDNDMCSNEIFMGKHYRSCPWVSDGRIDNTACNDCGAILIPKNKFGYARTRPGLFNDMSLKMALEGCKLDKESDNLDYEQIGMDFMDDLSRIKQFREPRLKENEYGAIGRIVYKYDMDKLNASLYKDRLTSVLNNVLNATDLGAPIADRYAKHRRRRKCGQREKDSAKVEQLKSMMGDLKYQGAVDGAIDEMKSDNRLGGSKTAYTQKYKPMDPNKFPRPYDAIWSSR